MTNIFVTRYIVPALSLKSISSQISAIRTGVVIDKFPIVRKKKKYVQSNSDIASSSLNTHKYL
jgi:hypothetical protein